MSKRLTVEKGEHLLGPRGVEKKTSTTWEPAGGESASSIKCYDFIRAKMWNGCPENSLKI